MDNSSAVLNEALLQSGFARAAAKGNPSHAYILEGDDADALKRLADGFAKLLLCEEHTGCGKCISCRYLAAGGHPDLTCIVPEKPGIIKVDDIREKLISDMGIRPYRSAYKIYIIEHAEWMNVQAQNAILKTLEEPPSYGVIMLLSCNTEALLPTIISRSVRMKAMRGGHGWDRMTEEERDLLSGIFSRIRGADAETGIRFSEEIVRMFPDPETVTGAVRTWMRDIMLLKLSGEERSVVIREALPALKAAAQDYTWRQINAILEMTDTAGGRIASGVNPAWTYELLLTRMR